MVTDSLIRLAPMLEAGGGDDAAETFNALLHGNDDDDFPSDEVSPRQSLAQF